MKLSAAIIDDEKLNINRLQSILTEYSSGYIDVMFTSTTIIEAVQKINNHKPDILFLDIQLDSGTAFDLIRKIESYNFFIVFVTAYDEYMINAFKHNVAYYILKPISPKEVNFAVNKIWRDYHSKNYTSQMQIQQVIKDMTKQNSLHTLAISDVKSINLVSYDEIIYCKSDGRYTEIYMSDGKVEVSAKNIGKYESVLPSNIFFRIHKSYLVNINKISVIGEKNGSYCILKNGTILPISKRKSALFFEYISM